MNMEKCRHCKNPTDIIIDNKHPYCAKHYVEQEELECLEYDIEYAQDSFFKAWKPELTKKIMQEIKKQHPELIKKWKKSVAEKGKLDYKRLKTELLALYKEYLKNPKSKKIKATAKEMHRRYHGATPILNKEIGHAINLLVDIAYDLPSPGKPSTDTVKKVINNLTKK